MSEKFKFWRTIAVMALLFAIAAFIALHERDIAKSLEVAPDAEITCPCGFQCVQPNL